MDGSGLRFGFRTAVAVAVLALVSFGLALTAVPNSGRNCRSDCARYPFTGDAVAGQFPGDYLWMFPAMALMLSFVALLACVYRYAAEARKIYGLVGLCFGVLAAAVLLIDYFVQVTVLQPSLTKGQLDGWSMLTQYNPNGVFIALEELGYLLMSLALAVVAPVFDGGTRVERAVRRLVVAGFAAAVLALAAVSAVFGTDRQDTFETAVIGIVWLTLLVTAPLVAVVFRRATPDPERRTVAR